MSPQYDEFEGLIAHQGDMSTTPLTVALDLRKERTGEGKTFGSKVI